MYWVFILIFFICAFSQGAIFGATPFNVEYETNGTKYERDLPEKNVNASFYSPEYQRVYSVYQRGRLGLNASLPAYQRKNPEYQPNTSNINALKLFHKGKIEQTVPKH